MRTTRKLLLSLLLGIGIAGTLQAKTNITRHFRMTRNVQKIESMKPGDQYVEVCLMDKTASVQTIATEADAKKLCFDGGKIHPDSCQREVTIKLVGPPGKTHDKTEVKYLNADGEECMVLIPLEK